MIYGLQNNFTAVVVTCGILLSVLLLPCSVFAQGAQTLTVSPTLFDIKAAPGQVWQSELRIVNDNPYDLTVYLQQVNFTAAGESGRPDFQPIVATETKGETLAEWIDITSEPVVIPRQKTVAVPFSVTTPNNAPPGGHYAAILVGTRPPVSKDGIAEVQTSQFVTALMFLRVAGTVIEKGTIRSFVPEHKIIQTAEQAFTFRFENEGNVHLQPQGDITITNMWGGERGVIPINQRTQFGKVLKDSIREYNYSWKGNVSIFDMGRYTAVLTLAYGDDSKQFTNQSVTFWIIPYKLLLLVAAILAGIIIVIVGTTRLYIRSVLSAAGVTPRGERPIRKVIAADDRTVVVGRYGVATAPLRNSVAQFRAHYFAQHDLRTRLKALVSYLISIRLFLLFCLALCVAVVILVAFYQSWADTNREFEVTIESDDTAKRTMSSEEIYFERLPVRDAVYVRSLSEYDLLRYKITLVNVSGAIGAAATMARQLESFGFRINSVDSDFEDIRDRTVILYSPDAADIALDLSKELGDALVSADVENLEENTQQITILVGRDNIQ